MMVCSFVLLLIPHSLTDKVDHIFSFLLTPFSKGSRDLSLSVRGKLPKTKTLRVSADGYQQLKDRLSRYQQQLINTTHDLDYYKDLVATLSGLRQLPGFERAATMFQVANIIGVDTSNLREVKSLDVGSSLEVQKNQLVLGSSLRRSEEALSSEADAKYQMAVVGKIIDVGPRTSHLQLLSDPGFCLKIVIEPNRQRGQKFRAYGMLKGKGMGRIEVTMISANNAIRPGDVVLAKADTQYLPIDMFVGTVVSCVEAEKNPIEWQITVQPAVDPHTLRQAIIVRN